MIALSLKIDIYFSSFPKLSVIYRGPTLEQSVLKRDTFIHFSQRGYDIIAYHAFRRPDKRTEQEKQIHK
jgi:hypothetical protein